MASMGVPKLLDGIKSSTDFQCRHVIFHNSIKQAMVTGGTILTLLMCPTSQADEIMNLPVTRNSMMMSAKNFDPARYQGRWFEVASLKRGFAGQGQEDCHCTQGVYKYDETNGAIQVDTFCVHGSPDGYITGIRGKVQCVTDSEIQAVENDLERSEMIKQKCFLKFPTLPFIPREPYDVLDTDYDNYALVSGAKGFGFVQIYSRTPNPGAEFIDKYKSYLAGLGYDASSIKDTPQDCETMSMNDLTTMMSAPGMEAMMNNTLSLARPVQFDPFTSVFDTFKKLVKLYFS